MAEQAAKHAGVYKRDSTCASERTAYGIRGGTNHDNDSYFAMLSRRNFITSATVGAFGASVPGLADATDPILELPSILVLRMAAPPRTQERLSVRGYGASGDGGGGRLIRLSALMTGEGIFSDATGDSWGWEETELSTHNFGARHDDTTDDTDALIRAMKWLGGNRLRRLRWANGIARTTIPLSVPDFAQIRGEGSASGLRNIYSGRGASQRSAAFVLGNWHPAHNGWRPAGAKEPFKRQIEIYDCLRPVTATDRTILLRSADADKFEAGAIYYLRTREAHAVQVNDRELEMPFESSLVRCTGSAPSGLIEFENMVGFSTSTPPLLCRIAVGARDPWGEVCFTQGVDIADISLYAENAFGSSATGAYNCHMRNIGGEVRKVIEVNGFAFCSFDGYHGTFSDGVGEFKFCAHDSWVRNIRTRHVGAVSPGNKVGMFAIGERCRSIVVSDFRVEAPSWGDRHIFQMQSSRSCRFINGTVNAPSSRRDAIQFYADSFTPIDDAIIDKVVVTHGSGSHIVFNGDYGFPPINNRISNCTFQTTVTKKTDFAVLFLCGHRNNVVGNTFHAEGVGFVNSNTTGNVVTNNSFTTETISGNAKRQNSFSGNHASNLVRTIS